MGKPLGAYDEVGCCVEPAPVWALETWGSATKSKVTNLAVTMASQR